MTSCVDRGEMLRLIFTDILAEELTSRKDPDDALSSIVSRYMSVIDEYSRAGMPLCCPPSETDVTAGVAVLLGRARSTFDHFTKIYRAAAAS